MSILQTQGLGKRFGGLDAVKDVSLDVEEGKITAVIGPNGAGKSTFFNLLAGFYRPTSGTVTFRGEDITGMAPHRTVRRGIARTFQTTNLFEDASVLENVLAGRVVRSKENVLDAVLRTPRSRREEKANLEAAREAMHFAGIEDFASDPAGVVPQEVQKRTAVALALATEPSLLLLDEPAAGITEEETESFGQLVREIVKRGVTVCLVEHKMSMIMSLADHILVLERGRMLAEGAPAEIQADPRVVEAYLGTDEDPTDGAAAIATGSEGSA
jgi:branched-chain amino acid transport system ATP-binding protein